MLFVEKIKFLINCNFYKLFIFQKKLVQDNTAYIREIIIQRGLELYRSIVGREFTELLELKKAIIMDLTFEKSKLTPKTLIL